jgi:hypothetical protein
MDPLETLRKAAYYYLTIGRKLEAMADELEGCDPVKLPKQGPKHAPKVNKQVQRKWVPVTHNPKARIERDNQSYANLTQAQAIEKALVIHGPLTSRQLFETINAQGRKFRHVSAINVAMTPIRHRLKRIGMQWHLDYTRKVRYVDDELQPKEAVKPAQSAPEPEPEPGN